MKYNIYVQDDLVDTVEANDTVEVLRLIGVKISRQELPYNNVQKNSIRIEPVHE